MMVNVREIIPKLNGRTIQVHADSDMIVIYPEWYLQCPQMASRLWISNGFTIRQRGDAWGDAGTQSLDD